MQHVTGDDDFTVMLRRLHDMYEDMVRSLHAQGARQQLDVRAAWEAIDCERAELARQRQALTGAPSSQFSTPPPPPPPSARQPLHVSGSANGRVASPTPAVGTSSANRAANQQRDDINMSNGNGEPTSFWITVWPGFHRQGRPIRCFVHSYNKHLFQVIEKAAKEANCQPAPNILYTPDGKTVATIEQLVPSENYLVFPSGCLYREDSVPTLLLEALVRGAAKSIHPAPFTLEYR